MSTDLQVWQTLDAEIVSMVDNFSNLVRAARIPDEDDSQQPREQRAQRAPGDMLEIWAEKLVYSGYTALHLISQLKKGALVSDFDGMVNGIRHAREKFLQEEKIMTEKLAMLKLDVQSTLAELEASYYSSAYPGKLVTTSVSEELKELAVIASELPEAPPAL